MAGPIASAFVDIVARLRLDPTNRGTLEAGLRQTVRRIENDLEQLEGAAAEAGRAITRQLGDVRINLNVREALSDIRRIDDAADGLSNQLHSLRGADVGFDTQGAVRNLRSLDDQLRKLARAVQLTDDEEINIDVRQSTRSLEILERAVAKLTAELRTVGMARPDIDVTEVIADLETLEEEVNDALRALGRLEGAKVRVNVESLEVDALETKIERLDREAIDIKVNTTGIERANRQLEIAEDRAGALKGAFTRIVAFGLIREAGQAIGQLFAAGVRASGAIQETTVALNRFFAQTRDLGQTSGEFLQNLRELALETPFEFEGLAETSRRILAMNKDADETVVIMSDLSDAVAAVGGGQGEIDGVVRALSQLASKGRVDLQDFRQISENLPSLSRQMQIKGVIDELNDLHPELNATIADFEALRKSGLITGKVLTDGVIRAIKDIPGVAGAARAASRTLQGALSNLADFATIEFADAFSGLGGIIADELNSAFSSVTEGAGLTPLAAAVRDVIEAFGRLGEVNLPPAFDAITEVAPEVSAAVDAISGLITEVLPLLTNLASGGVTAFTGLTSALRTFTQALSLLPTGVQEFAGGFITLATIIPGAGETLKASFVGVATSIKTARAASIAMQEAIVAGAATGKVALLAEDLAAKKVAISAAVAQAALTAGVLIAVTLIAQNMAVASKRADEFKDSISEASRSLTEFNDIGDAAVDFVNKFRIAGEGVNIGGLEKFLDGLTTGEIEQALGVTTQELGVLVEDLSRIEGGLEGNGDAVDAALRRAGLSAEDLAAAGGDAVVSLSAMSGQFREGSKRALDAAVSSQKFAFVSDEAAASITAAADATGDYGTGLEKLEKVNQDGAKAELANAAARGATTEEIDAAIAANTTYVQGADGRIKAETDWVAALQDVNAALQQQETIFQALGERYAGFTDTFNGLVASVDISTMSPGDLGQQFVDFALAVDEAGLSAEEMNAIANELGDTLGTVLSGEELTKVVQAFVANVQEFRGALEAVIPGVEDLQFELDSFSLNKFLEELDKIAEARQSVAENINTLLNEFGTVGADALDALLNSGLDKDMFAIALEQGIAGGETKLTEIAERFEAATGPEIEALARRLAAHGIDQGLVNEALGVDAFNTGVGDLSTAVDGLDPVTVKLQEKIASFKRAVEGASSPGQAKLLQDDLDRVLASGGAAEVPGIDTAAAVSSAASSGQQIGQALSSGVQEAAATGFAQVSAGFSTDVGALGTAGVPRAFEAGKSIGQAVKLGITGGLINLDDPLLAALRRAGAQGIARATEVGDQTGGALAEAFGDAAVPGLRDAFGSALSDLDRFAAAFEQGADSAGKASAFAFREGIDRMSDAATAEFAQVSAAALAGGFAFSLRVAAAASGSTRSFAANLDLDDAAKSEMTKVAQVLNSGSVRAAAGSSGFQVGFNFGRGVAAGVRSSIAQALDAVQRLVSQMFSAANKAAGISSPSKLFAGTGRNMGLGLLGGFLELLPQLTRASEQAIAAANPGRGTGAAAQSVRSAGGGIGASPTAAAALRSLSTVGAGPPGRAGAPSPAGRSVVNHWNISPPTDDPEEFARRVAARMERDLE
jgi:tape measure domain-containing protein